MAFNTFVSIVDTSLTVAPELYLKVVSKIMKVVSGSIMTGVTEATAYDLRLLTKPTLVTSVRLEPDFALIDM